MHDRDVPTLAEVGLVGVFLFVLLVLYKLGAI